MDWRRLIRTLSYTPREMPPTDIIPFIDEFWCDRSGFFIRGWVVWGGHRLDRISILVDGREFEVSRHDRADVLDHYPSADLMCGFKAYVDWKPFSQAHLRISTSAGTQDVPIDPGTRELGLQPATSPYTDFIRMVNEGALSVVEIGSRIVGSMSSDNRQHFPGASKYIGFDIHSAPGVDVVGDVHSISSLLGEDSVDAIYSLSVLEHLQMPWIAAMEMNKSLRPGGLVFHSTVHSWPLHEVPNDFWRFSDEGLKVLFGETFGFEIIKAEMAGPVTIIPDLREGDMARLPLNPGYAESCILARKVGPPQMPTHLGDRAKKYPKFEQKAHIPGS